jgi:hypothetical protein
MCAGKEWIYRMNSKQLHMSQMTCYRVSDKEMGCIYRTEADAYYEMFLFNDNLICGYK